MRIELKLVVDPKDIIPLYGELSEVYGFLVDSGFTEKYLRTEFPLFCKLMNISESVTVSQQNTRNYERLKGSETKKSTKLKLVKTNGKPVS